MKDNFVAKNLPKFNRFACHEDKKQQQKRGYQKHKGSW